MITANSARPRRLHARALPLLPATVRIPGYDRSSLTPAIVHIGVGGFHRAHQAVYLDDLAQLGHTAWGEVGVGLRSATMRDALTPQDCLFTVVERSTTGDRARVVGSMIDYRYGPDQPSAVLDALTDERTRVVTLTITGDGYQLDEAGMFRPDERAFGADLIQPHRPTTVLGYLVEALDRRRRAGLRPFSVLSCDNVPDNGRAARRAVVGFARLRDLGLAAWIEDNVAFPSTMVDRITPGTDAETRRFVTEQFGLRDRSPVTAEQFRQFVVEDDFSNGRPPWEEVGAQLVTDVAPYALIKKRLLNGGHCALGYLGVLAGYRTTADAMADPVIASYLAALLRHEIGPLLPSVPGIDLPTYQTELLDRFANVGISDDLARLCGRGSTKMPAYLLPSLVEARRQGRPTTLLALAVAGWLRYLRGYDLAGRPITIKDVHAEQLQQAARAGGTDPCPVLSLRTIFGRLADDARVVAAVTRALHDLDTLGTTRTMHKYVAEATIADAVRLGAEDHSASRPLWIPSPAESREDRATAMSA